MSIIIDTKKRKLAEFFCLNPTKSYTVRELSRQTKISPTWVSKIARELEKEQIIETKADANSLKIKPKRDTAFLRLKRILNLSSIYSSGLIDKLIEIYHKPQAIILFGSYSRGEDTENSDIDISVVTDRKEVEESYAKYEKKLKRRIDIKILNPKNITKEFAVSLANGIVLYGYFDISL